MVAEEQVESINDSDTSSTSFLKYSTQDYLIDLSLCSEERRNNGFKSKLLKQWEYASTKGTLNYQVEENCKFRKLEGQYNICLQLNEDRCRKRRKPMEFNSVNQKFDENLWNFTKLREEEILFYLDKFKENSTNSQSSDNIIAINASPLSIGHSLLIPSKQKCLPQILNSEAIKLSIEFILLIEDANFLIIYNGLMAHASVNHLHLQILFWPCRSGIMEKILKPLPTQFNWLYLLKRPTWYLPAFIFQLDKIENIELISRALEKSVDYLIKKGIAHNLFICRMNKFNNETDKLENNLEELVTLCLFPRKASKEGLFIDSLLTSTFVPAALEVAGLMPVYDSSFFNSTTESEIIKIFNERELMSNEHFDQLANDLINNILN